MNIDTLKKKRATARSSYTRTAKVLKDELEKEQPDKSILNDKFVKLQTIVTELKSYDSEMLDLMIAAKATDDNLETEVISCEEYSDEFITLSRRIKEKTDNSDFKINMSSNIDSSVNTCNEKRYKLPKIQIKKFDGQLLSYLSFWGQFKKIHEDKSLDDVDKFHYLAQSMLPGTRAYELIESYPLTSDNYPKVISAFEERFGNKEILTEIYVRELLKLIVQNVRAQGKDKLPLVSLFDKIESHLRALESLGVHQDSNTAWLYPMVESCLSAEMIRVWQRSVLFSDKGPRLSNLLEFLRKEVEGEQRVKLARSGFEISPPSREERPKEVKLKNKKPPVSAASLVATKEQKCVFCGKNHESKECFLARSLPLKEKVDKLRELKCCLRCLKPGHFARDCKLFIQCHVCKRSHPIILCPEIQEKKSESVGSAKGSTTVQATMSTPSCMKEVLLMTLMVEVVSGGVRKKVRCLLDCGSQRSYVLKSTAEALKLESLSFENLAHTLFGGTRTEPKNHKRYSMKLSPVGRRTEYQFSFLDQEKICGAIPRVSKGPLLKELKGHRIWISDVGDGYPEIEILIGSDIYGQILTGDVIQLNEGLTAINTKLGWTLCGEPIGQNVQSFEGAQSMLVTNLHVQNMKVSDMWSLETIGIADEAQTFSKVVEDQLAQEQFLKGLHRNEDGRYCVSLPWVQKFPPNISSNRHIAEKRLFATTRKLKKLNNFDEYDKIFKEWLSEDVIEKIPESEKDEKGHYLPHHPVIKLDSLTSKIRPVFDASCKSDNSLSLNDCLIKGPNLVEEIPAILMRFREKAIGVTSDIRRAFLQIGIKREDQNYLKFLWWENNKICEFRHKRVVFGVTSSPYLLAALISFHLKNMPKEFEVVAQKLSSSYYIDNCVTSVDTRAELEEFMNQATNIMAEAKMELRMWTFGPESETLPSQNTDTVSPVLGLQWDRLNDELIIPFKPEQILPDLSKRKILSIIHSIFDPLGFIVPIMVPAKLILQEAWSTKANWDLPLPGELKTRFLTWYQGLSSISQLKFPRRIGYGKRDTWSLNVFCDASRSAYATVIFLRSEDDGKVHVRFVAAKSRVSPLKKVTIPRLELLACVLGARLAKYIADAMFLEEVPIYYWTDATVALCWIQREENWGVFVNNRVQEIRNLSKKECWRHIPGKLNPADIASRGCTSQHLLRCGWWEGPAFLKTTPKEWPEFKFSPDEELIASELRRTKIINLNVKIEKPEWYERFSSFSKIVRVFCWMLRFANKLRKKPSYNTNTLTVEEKTKAEMILWGIEQKKYFHEKENSVHGLLVVRGDDDVLRVKTKIIEQDDELSFLYPVLLPSKHYLTDCLIWQYHIQYCHAGVQILAAKLRQQYWIISSKRNIRSCVNRCVICKRFTAKALTTPPIQLPLDRVRDSEVFETTGIDLCGPLLLKPKGKAWIVLYTCAVYRAIHLEPLTTLSTESFLQAFRRFIARRGRPSTVYSDNGTNFRGTDNALKRLDWQKIAENGCYPFKWKFNPPTAAWWGGWWERLIRSIKTFLVRILGRSSVNFEELLTILCDVEATINSRPLTYISDDSDELIPLTPSMFLQDIKQIGVPDLDSIDSNKLNVRVSYCNTLRQELRHRFRKEYLGQLVQKASDKCQELKVGDIVLIELENKKRVLWPMGKIVKIYNSRDGASRVVQVKTNNGCLTRPIQKLYPLEVSTAGDPVLTLGAENRSRYGRLLKPPAHGVLEVHKVNDCHSGRIHSFYNEISSVGLITKSKLYRKNLSRSKFYLSPPKPCFNYPLIQRDIQLKNCTTLDVKMNSKARKENDLKYTSTNLKQKRRELRECKALSLSRGRHSCGTLNEHSKKNRSTRIKSTKQEQYESAKTLFHNNVSPFASSMGRSKNKISSSATSSWQRDHRRSCRNANIFSHLSVIDRNEPHIRFSVRGTRIFGRRKSYRACPALKGDARSNGAFIKSRSSSLPCELSQVESHDYEFWNSGFVQSRVRKLEEELTAKCEDKFSYNYDYEVQSLCSLNLQKIQPDGDDYRIAYLSSTSQESSLDYMDDNYCSIGMGTLDVKLNKKYVIAGNEDWDLSFSSEENETTSEDDDEFFYRKYTNGGVSQSQMFNCIPGNYCISNDYDSTELSATKYGKKCSNNMGAGDTEDSNSSIIQQIHENVDRIFYNVMQYDFDIPQPIQEKPNKLFTLEYSSYLTNDGNKDENENLFEQKETINQRQLMNFNSSAVSEEHYKSNFSRNNGLNDNIACSSEEYSLLNPRDFSPQNELLKNNSADDSLDCSHKSFDNNQLLEQFSEFNILNITPLETGDNQSLNEKLSDNLFSNSSSIEADNTLNNLFTENEYWKNDDSNCVASENDSPVRKTSGYIINASTPNILLSTQKQLRNSEIQASVTEKNLFHVNNEPDAPEITLKNSDCIDYSFLSFNEVKATSDHVINCDEHILNKCNNLKKEIVALSKIPHSNKNPSKYKLKRNKWLEESKLTNVSPQTKSVLEVELERYEPLCTPFAEIYFITYGKNYPTTSSYKLDVQRKLLPDSKKEVEISINDQNVFTDTEEISEFDKLNRTRHATKFCANKNYQDTSISNSKRKCKNSESHSADILPISNVNEHNSLISIYHNAKITEQNRNTFSDNCFTTFLQNEKVLLYLFNKKHPIIIFRGLEELFQNVTQLKNCHSENNPMSNIFYNKFSDDCKALGDSKYLHYSQSKIKLFLFKWLELGKRVYRENKKGTANSANLLVSNSNLSNFSSSAILNIISIAQLLNILSPLLFTSKTHNKLFFPNFEPRQRKKCVDKTNRLINVKTISQTETQSKFIPDLCTSETNLHQKSLKYYDIRSRIHSKRESYSKLKKNIGGHSSETNKKLSKNIYRLKNKKCYRSKGINLYKNSTSYLRKNEKKCLVRKNHKNEYTSVTKKPGVCKQKQRTRNRNYRIDNYFLRETEISIEAPQAGENSFVAESLANLTTSPTSNATFVKYLFPPQLVSVRDTAKTRLSVSSIQHIQSVPAVQRLADRESRFTQSVKNHKHGSFRAATASVAAKITDSDFFCGSQDFCVLESICGGYPVALNSCKTEKITTEDHDFEDYVCFGSVPKGLQQLICDQVIFGDAKWITLNPTSVPLFESLQNMATCEENPRLKSKVIRTPGKNISKLRKLFDTGESGASDSDTLCSKKDDNKSLSSQSTNVNNTQNTEHKSEISERLSDIVNKNDTLLNNDFPEASKNETFTNTPQQRVSSDIPYCRQISKSGDLWKNVDIGVKSSNDGLWGSAPNNDYNSNDSFDHTDLRHGNNSFVSSTTDLHNLIAASKAELSKKKEPLLSDKSTLENYFTSFENSKPKKFVPLSSTDQSILTNDFSDHEISNSQDFKTSVTYDCDVSNSQNFKTSVTYDCDAEEMIFDEEDAVFSDTSSDEEIRCNPNLNNTHYLPAYALHTIIEESCEESERDSRNTTPTNEPVTSKLERYFSWDIINDTETDVKRKDDESTVYSDSLSEGSGSLNGDASKEIDPTQLASSRLEKYFTSGLVGNENYFYPDDAEFLEDGPVSDFEEDSIHQKISRSALLSSLENVTEKQESEDNESFEMHEKESESGDRTMSENVEQLDCDIILKDDSDSNKIENDNVKTMPNQDSEKEVFTTDQEIVTNDLKQECDEIEKIETTKSDEITVHTSNPFTDVILSSDLDNVKDSEAETKSIQKSDSELVENIVDKTDVSIPKPSVCKEQLAVDVRAIIKKLLVYFSDSEPNSFKHNVETDYISAWQILETEIERLIQSISPAASIENNSCNSSTIDSNNSDYGSDTVESLECMTDEDESADSKNRGNAKYPIVDLFNAAYKIQPGSEFHNFNISDETLNIWKRLIQSLQKDSFCMNDKLYDPNTEARLYIRDQIVNLMHTVTVNENKVGDIDSKISNIEDGEITSLIEEKNTSVDINEAFNVSVSAVPLLYSNDEALSTSKTEYFDDRISIETSENLETVETINNISDDEPKISNEFSSDIKLDSDLKLSFSEPPCVDIIDKDESPQTHETHFEELSYSHSEEINVNEIDIELNLNSPNSSDKKPIISSHIDINLNKDLLNSAPEKCESHLEVEYSEVYDAVKRSSLHMWISGETECIEKEEKPHSDTVNPISQKEDSLYVADEISDLPEATRIPGDASDFRTPGKSCRDTGYYSFKSSDDSILHDTPPPDEFMDVPNFKSLKRSVKKFPLANTLSKSSTNINQVFSVPDNKFSTLQLKNQKAKGSSNSSNSPSRQFTSLFSPTAVFKKLTGSKVNETNQTPESSIPSKYLKKYARSPSVETESMIGAISMPQLNCPRTGDSYSALGLYSENDRDSSLIADDDVEVKKYPAYSQSVLSLGAHSVSMTSVYSAAACHYGYVTISGDVLFGLNYNQKSQMMEVFVKQCRNLAAVDIKRNKSDPYVKVYLLPDKTKGGKRKTKTKKNTLSPVFNELLRFPVLKHELEARTLWLSVWNSDLFGRNDFLGEVMLPLGYRLLDSPTLRWYPLQERMESLTSPLNYRGELFLALKYVPRDLSLESRFRPAPVISLRGALHVLVKEARNISANGSGGNLDAFCKSYLLPDKSKSSKQKTPVVKRSRHPKWYYTMIYEDLTVDELKERSLELTVWDHDKITSNEFMGGIRLNLGSGLYHGVSVEWMDSRRDEAALWEAMLQSPNMWVDGCLPLRPTMHFHHG